MRNLALAVVAALAASLGAFAPAHSVPSAAAASTDPKVVIVVGATHGTTPTYRTRADAAYAEAIKYSSNVVKVYSPNATWANVKAALQGASVVMYMGHGNGFPSPYRTTPWPYSQNGFGLNQVAGQGDYNTQYYGEHYIAGEVKLAPNAVVLLNHLCYASGNSEPGQAEPTVEVAKQRADNYAAGFLKAGARAVIADGLMGPGYYIKSLFTTRQTIDQMWRGAPNYKGNAFKFASVRSPGYTVQMDPDRPTSGFYRAVSGNLALTTEQVTGTAYGGSDVEPSTFTVPGNAAVTTAGAGVFSDAALTPEPVARLPLDTRIRVLAVAANTRTPAFQVETHDGTVAGFMAAADLSPRDSLPPAVLESSASETVISPNGDGRQDAVTITARLSEIASWQVRVTRGTTVVWSASGEGSAVTATWNGRQAGIVVPDAIYRWTLTARDGWGNVGQARSGDVRTDTVAPSLGSLSLAAVSPAAMFSPNADGREDTVSLGWQVTEAGYLDAYIRPAAGGSVLRSMIIPTRVGSGSLTWDGKSNAGAIVPDGLYIVRIVARDAARNYSRSQERTIAVYGALSKVVASPIRFYPHDRDRFAPSTKLSFTLLRPATVTWQLTRSDGTPVRTQYANAALAAGAYSLTWDGTGADGKLLPVGRYLSAVRATNGQLSVLQRTSVDVNAFSVVVSDTTPARGQTLTVTATSAEPLSGNVYLHVTQPGLARWSVRLVGIGTLTYRATVTLPASSAGPTSFRVSALDGDGRFQATTLVLPLQ